MLYEEGQLTEEQAQQIIGEKMVARINFLNDWMNKNGYFVMLHSTFKSNVPMIISDEGLHYPIYETIDSKEIILDNCAISEQNLKRLESWIKNNHRNAMFQTGFETYRPGEMATTVGYKQLSAKLLLEYNHRGADATIVFCVPMKKQKIIGRAIVDPFQVTTRTYDPYLRRKISGKLQKDGSVEFKSTYSYPAEGILFAFDRDKIRIKFNENFDEEYYLDDTTPQLGNIHKGEVLQGLRNLEQQMNSNQNIGRSR